MVEHHSHIPFGSITMKERKSRLRAFDVHVSKKLALSSTTRAVSDKYPDRENIGKNMEHSSSRNHFRLKVFSLFELKTLFTEHYGDSRHRIRLQ